MEKIIFVSMTTETDKNSFDFEQYRIMRERSIGRLLWRMKRYMESFVEPRLHQQGFTDFKMSYLMFLANIGERGTTNNELAKRACVTKQMMSKIVGLLEADGYIYTQKNPADSRSSVIFLNDRGKELFMALKDSMQQARDQFDAIVGHDRMDQVIDTLLELVTVLEADNPTSGE